MLLRRAEHFTGAAVLAAPHHFYPGACPGDERAGGKLVVNGFHISKAGFVENDLLPFKREGNVHQAGDALAARRTCTGIPRWS